MTRNLVLAEISGGLWHTTHRDRYARILSDGVILPEPEIPDHERWKTSRGEHYYPYVRTLGGVSLFDMNGFDPESYSQRCPSSSWAEFIPFRRDWGHSVWIEIHREAAAPRLVSPADLVLRWKADNAYRHTIMPHLESAHLGPIPVAAFKRAFVVCDGDLTYAPLDTHSANF